MALLKRFALGEKHFLSVALYGKRPEVRISSPGKKVWTLTVDELEVLHNAGEIILQKDMMLSTFAEEGGVLIHQCAPDISSDGLRFTREFMYDSQPFNYSDLHRGEYTIPRKCADALVRHLPQALDCVCFIQREEPAISLAYDVVADQVKRLCASENIILCDRSPPEHFLHIMRLLGQYVPISFLEMDFKKRSPGTVLNVRELLKSVMCQYEHLLERCK